MKTNTTNHSSVETQTYKPLYALGSGTAVAMVVLTLIQFAGIMASPPPYDGNAADWFALFQANQLLGLIGFELPMILYMLVSIPLTLALCTVLRPASPSFTLLYLALSLIGVTAFIAARPVVEMAAASQGYATAATEAQKTVFLAAGQSLLAAFHGTAFHVSYLLGSLTGLIVSGIMLKSRIFGKATAYLRVASSLCDLGLYVPVIGMYISIFSVLFLSIWTILVARRLFQLSQAERLNLAPQAAL